MTIQIHMPMNCLSRADIIKVDFMNTDEAARIEIETLAKQLGKEMVAEKLETREDYETARTAGYHYFQGYYFSKPSIMSTHDVPAYIHTYYGISKHIRSIDPDIDMISNLIEQDISLSYKLLKLINTLGFGLKHKVTSIRQAIVLIGLMELQKWLYVLAVREKDWNNGISYEIMSNCLIRARMCESVAKLIPGKINTSGHFLTGMFSLMDSILNLDMEEILVQVPLDEAIMDALSGKSNTQRDVLDLVLAVEKADWVQISKGCRKLGIEEKDLFKVYAESLNWAKELMEDKKM
ncbi:HDOD domain-containing protein [Niallia sp. Man26]|uniref:EAL and HDOD domain-containing protein n=1 Tax=Niallia sp. Man26 TaxID=2912824 RepID=UPI0020488FE3|nr:HDOD domain-containing protein [Niallia sp. Man26]UPO86283.1 HDOD domain-containing protein [Niallia sp. Man26]